jgi:hypothetical protein
LPAACNGLSNYLTKTANNEKSYLKTYCHNKKRRRMIAAFPASVKTIPAPGGAGSYHFIKTKL